MGRVTRAAARADPILADETSTVAESALSDDPANVALPPSAQKVSERPPLGEIKVNDQGTITATSSNSPPMAQQAAPAEDNQAISAGESSNSDGENQVVLVLGVNEKATVKGKKNNKGTVSSGSKKLTKKAKSTASRPSPEVVEQMRQAIHANVKTFKGQTSKKSTKKSRSNKPVAEDEETVSQSDASSEAAEMLMEKTSAQDPVLDEYTEAAPSPAVLATKTELAKTGAPRDKSGSESENDGSASKNVAIAKQSPQEPKPPAPELTRTRSDDSSAPCAVKKLAMMFQPHVAPSEEPKSNTPLADIVSRESLGQQPAVHDPIGELDALEENIEAVEKSIAAAEKRVSPSKPAKKKPVANSTTARKSSPVGAEKVTGATTTVAKKSLRETTSPTDRAIEAKKQTKARSIEALNTPEKPKKSAKPPTTSKFQLSSEATAAKLKAQREERQKRREEEEQKQKEMKAKPIVNRTKPVEVRPTATSRARMSLAAAKSKDGELSGTVATKTVNRASTVGVMKATANARRPSTLVVRPNGSPSIVDGQAMTQTKKSATPNTIAKAPRLSTLARSSRPSTLSPLKQAISNTANRAPRPSVNTATSKRNSLYPKPAHATSTKRDAPAAEKSLKTAGTVKGKEVFNRDKIEKGDRERALKEKMDAAKKARLEAAERGRAASKAWAEKKKKHSEASKSRSTSAETPAADASRDDDNKENDANGTESGDKLQESKELTTSVLAVGILKDGEMSQDDAGYIVAEMERIDEVRKTASGQA